MYNKLLFIAVALFLQSNLISGQRQWVPETVSADQMRNPYTWYLPYAKAAAEGYKEYFEKAQQITNELYKQSYLTEAFPWAQNQANQAAQQASQAAGQASQAAGQASQAAGQAGQAAWQAGGEFINPNGQGQWGGRGQWTGQ